MALTRLAKELTHPQMLLDRIPLKIDRILVALGESLANLGTGRTFDEPGNWVNLWRTWELEEPLTNLGTG